MLRQWENKMWNRAFIIYSLTSIDDHKVTLRTAFDGEEIVVWTTSTARMTVGKLGRIVNEQRGISAEQAAARITYHNEVLTDDISVANLD